MLFPQKPDWILGRSVCLYRLLPMKNIPKRDWEKALSIRLNQISPWNNTGSYIVYSDNSAQVWLWDEDARNTLARENNATKSRPIPEPLLRKKPQTDGPLLYQCLDGVELQYWQNDTLLLSHWWKSQPSYEKLCSILQTNDLVPPKKEQLARAASLQNHPWAASSTGVFSSTWLREKSEQLAWLILLFFFITFTTWFSTQYLQLHHAIKKEKMVAQKLQAKLETSLQSRSRSAENLHYINSIRQLRQKPYATLIFATALKLIDKHQATLISWNYHNANLVLDLSGKPGRDNQPAALNEAALIVAFEKDPLFQNVRVNKDKSASTLRLILSIPAEMPQHKRKDHE